MSIHALAHLVCDAPAGRYFCFPHWEFLDFLGQWVPWTEFNVPYQRGAELRLPDGNRVRLQQVLSMENNGGQYFLALYNEGGYCVLLRNRVEPTAQQED